MISIEEINTVVFKCSKNNDIIKDMNYYGDLLEYTKNEDIYSFKFKNSSDAIKCMKFYGGELLEISKNLSEINDVIKDEIFINTNGKFNENLIKNIFIKYGEVVKIQKRGNNEFKIKFKNIGDVKYLIKKKIIYKRHKRIKISRVLTSNGHVNEKFGEGFLIRPFKNYMSDDEIIQKLSYIWEIDKIVIPRVNQTVNRGYCMIRFKDKTNIYKEFCLFRAVDKENAKYTYRVL